MRIRSKAPLRIGLAGGGTDVSPYSDQYGGAVLNATVGFFAHCTIHLRTDGQLLLHSIDLGQSLQMPASLHLPINGQLDLMKGVYNRMVRDYAQGPLPCTITTHSDVPKGSGLGGSSTITVAMVAAFAEWLSLPLGNNDVAQLAYAIEREDLKMAGGKQDQYAATFGGVNFMEFQASKVVVNPLRIRQEYLQELEFCTLLYDTGTSRLSSAIIAQQAAAFQQARTTPTQAAHQLKAQAHAMKKALLTGQLDEIGHLLDEGWHCKKQMARDISNPMIDHIYTTAKEAGATGGKISGAGGGGFMVFYCPKETRYPVMRALETFGGELRRFTLTKEGVAAWRTA